jgi:hypothetical protein
MPQNHFVSGSEARYSQPYPRQPSPYDPHAVVPPVLGRNGCSLPGRLLVVYARHRGDSPKAFGGSEMFSHVMVASNDIGRSKKAVAAP